MNKKQRRTALLTPGQVREAVVAWAHAQGMFPTFWTIEEAQECAVVLGDDGTASIRIEKKDS